MATGFTKNFVVKNGITTGNITLDAGTGNITGTNLSVTGVSNLGAVGNVRITGGTSGQAIVTDGLGNLSFANASASSSPAPMPTYVAVGDTVTISANYQGIFGYPITIDGAMVVDGILVDVNDATVPAGNINFVQYNNGNVMGGSSTFTFVPATGLLSVPNITTTGNITGSNLTTSGILSVTGNANIGNAINVTGNVVGTGAVNAFGDLVNNPTFSGLATRSLNLLGNSAVMRVARTTTTGNPAVELLGLDPSTGAINDWWDFFTATDTFLLRRRTGGAANTLMSASTTGVNFPTGDISATGNITGGNLITAGIMSSTGNATHGNIITSGLITATGNITGGNIITTGVVKTTATTYSSLPIAATAGAGARSFITDANTTTFLATVGGGGSNAVPVVSNGTFWVVG